MIEVLDKNSPDQAPWDPNLFQDLLGSAKKNNIANQNQSVNNATDTIGLKASYWPYIIGAVGLFLIILLIWNEKS